MKEKLNSIKVEALNALKNCKDINGLNDIKVKYLGKQGELTLILRGMRDVLPEERPVVGALVNEVRQAIETKIEEKENFFEQQELNKKLESEKVDITEPSKDCLKGALHPITRVIDKLCDVCVKMGFEVVQGPEVETDYYNFEALNIPKNHPSRDMQDSFFITDKYVLRTQTSAVQVREMEKRKPPFKIVCPGRTYRNDSDSTHSPMFHQFEGLVVDENVSMADLKIMLNTMLVNLFGPDTKTRFRPSFFPFTEPSVEVDVTCPNCGGKGCRLCKGTGWLEMLGAGVVNPKVLEMSGIDSKKYKGIAFGPGVDRLAMIENTVPDLRTMFRNDIRFLKQMK